jgi:hypothetical protein
VTGDRIIGFEEAVGLKFILDLVLRFVIWLKDISGCGAACPRGYHISADCLD